MCVCVNAACMLPPPPKPTPEAEPIINRERVCVLESSAKTHVNRYFTLYGSITAHCLQCALHVRESSCDPENATQGPSLYCR